MTALALFVLGLLIITGIARYNNSNKLFWTLLTCFTLGFVCTKLVHDAFSTNEKSNVITMQAQPTQALAVTSGSLLYLLTDESLPTSVKVASNPVSQANVPTSSDTTLSDVSGVTQGLYLHALPNPPNIVEVVDDS